VQRSTWGLVAASLAILVLASAAPAHAGLVITPTFDSTITNDPNAAAIKGVINSAIHTYESLFTNPITVNIEFHEMSGGLGESDTFISFGTYTAYLTALKANATSAAQLTALASLPAGPNNPVNGNPDVFLTTANLRALGINVFPPGTPPAPDSSIGLNTSITFPPNAQSGSTYSLLAVTEHEINEALGLGSALNGNFNGSPPPTGAVSPMDLYRYDQNGTRTFNTDPNTQAFFSIDGGKTDLVQFNQFSTSAIPADYQDWFSNGPHTPRVQDAFATPGVTPTLGPDEITALNVLGYNLQGTVPEPSALSLFSTGMLIASGFGWGRRKQRAGHHAA
jgi:hypothetical protein